MRVISCDELEEVSGGNLGNIALGLIAIGVGIYYGKTANEIATEQLMLEKRRDADAAAKARADAAAAATAAIDAAIAKRPATTTMSGATGPNGYFGPTGGNVIIMGGGSQPRTGSVTIVPLD